MIKIRLHLTVWSFELWSLFAIWDLVLEIYQLIMSKVTSIEKARSAKANKAAIPPNTAGFVPCSPDMTICGDCTDNRAKKKCPRLKEWLAQRGR